MLEQELTNAQAFVQEMLLAYEVLENETIKCHDVQETSPTENETEAIRYHVIRHILDEAPQILRWFFDEDVTLNEPEEFVMLPNNRILISGQWVCFYHERTYTIEAIFSFWIRNDELRLNLLSYSPFGWADWISPWESHNQHAWVRHHELETVPVRFYWMGGDRDEVGYNIEYLTGETFSEELAYHAQNHLNRRIVDAWFVGRILYVNLHHSEPMRMSSGTFGEYAMYTTLVSSMVSVPDIDALVIMVNGQREATIGGHGMTFRDIYLINSF